jgi:hypothetical protein
LSRQYPGHFLAIFPRNQPVEGAESLGDRSFLAFDNHEAARKAFIEHVEWLDYDINFAVAPG